MTFLPRWLLLSGLPLILDWVWMVVKRCKVTLEASSRGDMGIHRQLNCIVIFWRVCRATYHREEGKRDGREMGCGLAQALRNPPPSLWEMLVVAGNEA